MTADGEARIKRINDLPIDATRDDVLAKVNEIARKVNRLVEEVSMTADQEPVCQEPGCGSDPVHEAREANPFAHIIELMIEEADTCERDGVGVKPAALRVIAAMLARRASNVQRQPSLALQAARDALFSLCVQYGDPFYDADGAVSNALKNLIRAAQQEERDRVAAAMADLQELREAAEALVLDCDNWDEPCCNHFDATVRVRTALARLEGGNKGIADGRG